MDKEKSAGSFFFAIDTKKKTSEELKSELKRDVLFKKYLLDGEKSENDLYRRVAKAIASVEKTPEARAKWEERFYELMKNHRFIPGGRILFGAGNPKSTTLMNCFVNPIKEDSIEGIYEAAKEVARTFSLGGGEGIDISILRPQGSETDNSARSSTGSVSFMHLFSLTTGLIGQCLAEDTKVLTRRGLIEIKNIQVGDKVWTENGWRRVINKINSGEKQVYKIKTRAGFEIKASEDHKFYVPPELSEKQLKELKRGDKITLIAGTPARDSRYIILADYMILTEDIAYFLGFFYGSGAMRDGVLSYFTCYEDIGSKILSIIEKNFKTDSVAQIRQGGCYSWKIKSDGLAAFFIKNKNFISKILASPPSVQAAFLAGLHDATNPREDKISFLATKRELAQSIQIILMSLGVITEQEIVTWKETKWGTFYLVSVLPEKNNEFLAINLLKKWSYHISARAQKLGDIGIDNIKTLYEDEIISIEEDGIAQTYDITLEDTHRFFANGFYVSNSGRRGALMLTIDIAHPDVIAFIYAKSKPDNFTREIIMMNEGFFDKQTLEAIEKVLTDSQMRFANISIKIRDEFMHAVLNDKDWEFYYYDLVDPRQHDVDIDSIIEAGAVLNHDMPISPYDLPNYGGYQLWEVRWNVKPDKNILIDGKYYELRKKRVYGKIPARRLMRIIAESIWRSGDPGLLFWDNILKEHNAQYFQPVLSTNPCVVGDTRIATDRGLIKVEELYLSQELFQAVYDKRAQELDPAKFKGTDLADARPIFKTHDAIDVYEVILETGNIVRATDYHHFYVVNKEGKIVLKQLKDLNPDEDRLMLQSGMGKFGKKNLDLLARAYACYIIKKSKELLPIMMKYSNDFQDSVESACRKTHYALYKWANSYYGSRVKEEHRRFSLSNFYYLAELLFNDYGISPINTIEDLKSARVPDELFKANYRSVVQFLRTLFSGLSNVWTKRRAKIPALFIGMYALSKEFLQDIQLLLNNMGIVSFIYKQDLKPHEQNWSSGIPYLYRIVISSFNAANFVKRVGFIQNQLFARANKWYKKYKKYIDYEYKNHDFAFRIVEIKKLPEKQAVYDTEQFKNHSLIFNGIVTGNCSEKPLPAYGNCDLGSINLTKVSLKDNTWKEKLRDTIWSAVRFLDNVIDYTNYPMPVHEKASKEARRLGLGIMGLADFFIKHKVKYDSKRARDMINIVMEFIKIEAYKASIALAKEKGVFPAFNFERMKDSSFMKRLPEPLLQAIDKYGIRNSEILSIAPTGSISIIAGNISSGIEPVFSFHYKRYSIGKLYDVYHSAVIDYFGQQGVKEDEITEEHLKQLPDYFISSHEVDWQARVDLQGIIQKHVDSAISSTINLPNEAEINTIEDILMYAWQKGLKGITIFRDGSKAGVLSTKKKIEIYGQEIEVYDYEIKVCPACGERSLITSPKIKDLTGCSTYCVNPTCGYSTCDK